MSGTYEYHPPSEFVRKVSEDKFAAGQRFGEAEAAKHLQAAREETARAVAKQLRAELGRTWRLQFKNSLQWQTIAEMLRQYGGPSGNSFALPSESEYDLGGTRLSYSDFKLATFLAVNAIKTAAADLIGDDLNYADLSGTKLTANPFANEVTIDFSGVNLTNDDLGYFKLHYALIKYPISAPKYINFTKTNFTDTDTGTLLTSALYELWKLEADEVTGVVAANLTTANLTDTDAHDDLSGSEITAGLSNGKALFNATVLPPTNNVGGGGGELDVGPASQTIEDEGVAGWGIFLIILVFLLVLTPVLCYIYASTKYGSDKVGIWFRYKCSHSNPELPFLYKPREELERIRNQLSTVDDTQGKQLSIEDDTEDMGSRRTAV